MYYFLAIVKKKDILNGNIVPSYILCKNQVTSDKRSPYRIVRPDNALSGMPKVLVTSLVGNDHLIDFMSAYRTRDKMYRVDKRKTKAMRKYYPEGALFWFPCDIEGRQKGPALFIKQVPDKNIRETDKGFQRLKEALSKRPRMNETLSQEPGMLDLTFSHIKPKLKQ